MPLQRQGPSLALGVLIEGVTLMANVRNAGHKGGCYSEHSTPPLMKLLVGAKHPPYQTPPPLKPMGHPA